MYPMILKLVKSGLVQLSTGLHEGLQISRFTNPKDQFATEVQYILTFLSIHKTHASPFTTLPHASPLS